MTLQTDVRADGQTDERPAGRTCVCVCVCVCLGGGGYNNIPAFSSKSAGIIIRTYAWFCKLSDESNLIVLN